MRDQLLAERPRVRDHLLGVRLPCWLTCLQKRGRDTGNGLLQKVGHDEYHEKEIKHTLLWGPPWQAGKTASLTRFSRSFALSLSFLKKIRPARGPRNVLCLHRSIHQYLASSVNGEITHVVVVTTSQYWKGSASSPAATSPLVCAISAMRNAPCSSAIARSVL